MYEHSSVQSDEIRSFEKVVLGVAIVNYYSASSVDSLLRSLSAFAGTVKTVVAIIDNSLDETGQETERLESLSQSYSSASIAISVIRSPINRGYGSGNNAAVTTLLDSDVDLIWVLNPDTQVRGQAVDMIADVQASSSDIWSTSTLERNAVTNGFGIMNLLTGKGNSSSTSNCGKGHFWLKYPAGHSILFRRDAWLRLRGFDESYFLFMEEADLALRAEALGMKIGSTSSVIVDHESGLTTGTSSDFSLKSNVAFREATKSRIIFFRRHFPARLPLIILLRFVYACAVFVRGNRKGSVAILQGLAAGIKEGR